MLLTRTIQYSQKQIFRAKNDDGCLHLNGNVRQGNEEMGKLGNGGKRDNLQFCIQIYYSIFIKVIPTFQYVE